MAGFNEATSQAFYFVVTHLLTKLGTNVSTAFVDCRNNFCVRKVGHVLLNERWKQITNRKYGPIHLKFVQKIL